MKCFISIGLVASGFFLFGFSPSSVFATSDQLLKVAYGRKAPSVGEIKSKLESGCSCYLWLASNLKKNRKPVFAYLADNNPVASMNIDGQDIQLKRVFNKSNKKQREEKWIHDDITVSLYYSLTGEGYEVSKYNVKIVVNRGKQSTSIQAKGECGC
jgi:hypothetical protein